MGVEGQGFVIVFLFVERFSRSPMLDRLTMPFQRCVSLYDCAEAGL